MFNIKIGGREQERSRRSQRRVQSHRGGDEGLLGQIIIGGNLQKTCSLNDNRIETAPITVDFTSTIPRGLALEFSKAQDYSERMVQNARTLEDYIKWRHLQVSLTPNQLQLFQKHRQFRNMKENDILNAIFSRDVKKEVRTIRSLYQKLRRVWKNDGNIHLYLSAVIIDEWSGLAETRALLQVPNHNFVRDNPPYSGELYYLIPDSICIYNAVVQSVNRGVCHLGIPNLPIQKIQKRLWPNQELNSKRALTQYLSGDKEADLYESLKLENEEVSSDKFASFMALAAFNAFPASDPTNFNLTPYKSRLR